MLHDITFDVPGGSTFSIMGPSGSGKTTLLSMLGGLLQPSDGRIRIGDDVYARVDAGRFDEILDGT